MTERRTQPDRRAHLLPRLGPQGRRATDAPGWLSISAYARTWGLTRNTVYKLLENGNLETYRVLTVVRIRNVSPDEHSPDEGTHGRG